MKEDFNKGVGKTINKMIESGKVYIQEPLKLKDKSIGQKFDNGKLEMGEFFAQFPNAIEGLCKVAQYGKNKYSEGNGNVNFKAVPNSIKRYKDAMVRHMMAYLKGDLIDNESKEPHLYHLLWNVGALIELEKDNGEARKIMGLEK